MKKIIKWFRGHKKASLLLILIIIAGVFFFQSRSSNGGFDTANVERGVVAEELILSGVVMADEHAQLAFPAGGRLTWVNAKEGVEVARGQALASVDTVTLNSALERAQADLRAAEANRAAVYDSLQGKDTSETFAERNTRTQAEVSYDKAYEAYIAARQNLRDATLISPFAGIVTYVANPFSGVNVLAGQTQIEIVNPQTIYFAVYADQNEVTQINVGDDVKILFDATDEEFSGIVEFVSFTTLPQEVGAVYEVKVNFDEIENNNFQYRLGMTGDAYFVLQQKNDVLFVPSDFINSDTEGKYVLINEGNEKAYIETGIEGEDRTEITSGIQEGMTIYD